MTSGGPGQPDEGPSEAPIDHRVDLDIDGLSEVAMVGSGGSSTVYSARQIALDREVAVKVVHAAWSIETRERFEQEREVMGRLTGHTGIAPILQTGITSRGEPYLLMPYYERGSLFRLVRERGPLPWRDAVFLMEPVVETLADCHDEGIVHRDVKPGNILLTRHLHPRLTDFGIAQPTGMATSPSTLAYTPFYSPPEAYRPALVAPSVDVHAAAATLWVLIGGPLVGSDRPRGPSARTVLPPLPADQLPGPVAEVLDRATDADPANRPVDASELLAELRRAVRLAQGPATLPSHRLANRPSPATLPRPLPSTPEIRSGEESVAATPSSGRGWARASRVRTVTVLAAVAVLAGLVLLGWALWGLR